MKYSFTGEQRLIYNEMQRSGPDSMLKKSVVPQNPGEQEQLEQQQNAKAIIRAMREAQGELKPDEEGDRKALLRNPRVRSAILDRIKGLSQDDQDKANITQESNSFGVGFTLPGGGEE